MGLIIRSELEMSERVCKEVGECGGLRLVSQVPLWAETKFRVKVWKH